MSRTYSGHITRRRDGHSQVGCLLIRKTQPLKWLSQCSTVKPTNTRVMVLRNMVVSNLIAGEAQAVEGALMIFGTLPQLTYPSSHSRKASEQPGLPHYHCVPTILPDQVEGWVQHRLNLSQHRDHCQVKDQEAIRPHRLLLLAV